MMRSRSIVCCGLLSLLTAGVASAAINFQKPMSFTVSPRPEFMAVADFNSDGHADVATSSPRSKEVNLLLGNPDGVFTPGTVVTVGTLLSTIVAGDLNRDGNMDLVVCDERAGAVFILVGQGDATFDPPIQRAVGRNPFGVALGDFDGVNGLDLAVSDRTDDRVYILLNSGRQSPSFTAGGDYQVGQGPEDIIVDDFNQDNAPDIVTLNKGGSRVKDVTVLLFERIAANLPVFIRVANFGVGERPEQMIATDLNNDDILDLAMLNRPLSSRDGEVDFLLGQGNGFLTLIEALPLPCPFFSAVLGCRPRGLAAADFDADGNVDLAVSLSDPRQGASTDLLNVFNGGGDGFFVPGPTFTTDRIPVPLGIGDIDAGPSGSPDIIIASQRRNTIQPFLNISTVVGDRIPGQRCDTGEQCSTGLCIDDVCCRTECIPGLEICNAPDLEGTCQPLDDNRPIGFPCDEPDQCVSEFCTHGRCCVAGVCPSGARCDILGTEGTCQPPLVNGEECEINDHCRSSRCVDGFCCDTSCPAGRCDVPGSEGTCTPPQPNGEPCAINEQCSSQICDFTGLICCDEVCDVNQECQSDGTGCMVAPTPRATPGFPGAPCGNADACMTDTHPFCTDGVCCSEPACGPGEACAEMDGNCLASTPTPGPTSTPPRVCPAGCVDLGGGSCACGGRSGGCSTADGPTAGAGDIILAMLLPLMLWVGRRAMAKAR